MSTSIPSTDGVVERDRHHHHDHHTVEVAGEAVVVDDVSDEPCPTPDADPIAVIAAALVRLVDDVGVLAEDDVVRAFSILKATGPAQLLAPGEFQQQYAELVRAGIDRALESNAVAQALDKYLAERVLPINWQGTAGQLYDLLNNQIIPDRSTWPKSPKGLADQLRRIAPAYRAKGIEISHLGHSREGALWRIALIRSSNATPPGVSNLSMGGIPSGDHQ